MSESSLPSNSSQPDQGVLHSANADAIERQSLYDREETIQRLLAEQPTTIADAFAAVDPQRLSTRVGELAGEGTPQPEDLVVLIQALNQCNSNLLARVSELEGELANRQAELKAQKTQPSPSEDPALRAELNTVKQKVMKLRQQMNTAHQANQSQRACIQALRQNLADAEQKQATLTDAHAQLQTQFQEQSQRLTEAENTCRDLCLRLHRQQQYTLQFKAALKARARAESSVQEPVSATSSGFEVASPSTVREIRPWSAQPSEVASEAVEKMPPVLPVETGPLDNGDRSPTVGEPSPFIEVAILPNPDAPDALVSLSDEVGDCSTTTPSEQNPMPLDLPAFPSIQQLSAIAEVTTDAPVPDAQPDTPPAPEAELVAAPGSRPLAPISFNMKQGLPKWAKFTHMPLPTEADPVPEAPSPTVHINSPIVADQSSVEPVTDPWITPEAGAPITPELVSPASAALPNLPDAGVPPLGMGHEAPTPEIDLDPVLLEQLDAAVRPLLDSVVDAIRGSERPVPPEIVNTPEAIAPVPSPQAPVEVPPPALPRKPDVDRAEEDLWRDLAKLVNISTDDIIQASLSGDFDAFTSIDFDALRQSLKEGRVAPAPTDNSAEATLVEPPSVEPTPVPTAPPALASAHASLVHPPSSSIRSFQDGLDLPFYNVRQEPSEDPASEEAPVIERSPSPVIYPDRAPRKLPSIAAIDLPSFPRPQPG